MEIGLFRQRITIQSVSRLINEHTGQQEESWVNGSTIWARKEMLSGNEKDKDSIVTASDKTNFLIRFGHNVNNPLDYRIKYNSKYYDIESIEEVEFNAVIRLRCVQRSNTTT